VDKIDALLAAVQKELKRHNYGYFVIEVPPHGSKVQVPGCLPCQKEFRTIDHFVEHLADEALPALFINLRAKKEAANG